MLPAALSSLPDCMRLRFLHPPVQSATRHSATISSACTTTHSLTRDRLLSAPLRDLLIRVHDDSLTRDALFIIHTRVPSSSAALPVASRITGGLPSPAGPPRTSPWLPGKRPSPSLLSDCSLSRCYWVQSLTSESSLSRVKCRGCVVLCSFAFVGLCSGRKRCVVYGGQDHLYFLRAASC